MLRRAGMVTAAASAINLAGSSMASAHHCYRDYWQPQAYAQHQQGNTAWVPLSDLGTMFIIGPEYAAQCGYVADDAVKAWMASSGQTQEPLIQSHAILHQASRERDVAGQIIATLDDYAAVRELVSDQLSEGVGSTVSPVTRETVAAVEVGPMAAGIDVWKIE